MVKLTDRSYYQLLNSIAVVRCKEPKEEKRFVVLNPATSEKIILECKTRGNLSPTFSSFDVGREEWGEKGVEVVVTDWPLATLFPRYKEIFSESDKKKTYRLLSLPKESSRAIAPLCCEDIVSGKLNNTKQTCFKIAHCKPGVQVIQSGSNLCLCSNSDSAPMNIWYFTKMGSESVKYELDFEKSGIPEKRASLSSETTFEEFLRNVYNMFKTKPGVSPVMACTFHLQAMNDKVGDDGENVFKDLIHAGEISKKETLRFFLIQGKRCRQGKKLWKLEALSGDLKKRFGSLQLTLEKA